MRRHGFVIYPIILTVEYVFVITLQGSTVAFVLFRQARNQFNTIKHDPRPFTCV